MSDDEQMVKIKIKILGSEQDHEIEVPLNLTIESLKILIQDYVDDSSAESLRLIFRGHSLKNNETLATHHIENGHTIIVVPSKKKESDIRDDPPPPPTPTDQQSSSVELPQSPSLPPLPLDPIYKVKKTLSLLQKDIAIINGVVANLQLRLYEDNNQKAKEEMERYIKLSDVLIEKIEAMIKDFKKIKFISNNSRIELDPNYHPDLDSQKKPIVQDILSTEEKEEIKRHFSQLESYIQSNKLHESYKTSNLYKEISSNKLFP